MSYKAVFADAVTLFKQRYSINGFAGDAVINDKIDSSVRVICDAAKLAYAAARAGNIKE